MFIYFIFIFIFFVWEKNKIITIRLTNRRSPRFSGVRKQCKHQKNNAAYFGVGSIVRDDNHGSGPRAYPVKDCRGTVLGRGFLGPQICGPCGTGLCGTEFFAGWAETGHAGLHGPAFFSSFLILPEKARKRVRRKRFLWLFP